MAPDPVRLRPDVLLDGLDDGQRKAVTSPAAPLCILAGAGSGKTRVLTRRIAYRVSNGTADASYVLALTFTRKAATQLRERLALLGIRNQVVAGTFHSVAYAQLRRLWADRDIRPPALLERKARLLGPLLPRQPGAGASGRAGGSRVATLQVGDVAAEIEWAKARMVPPQGYEAAVSAHGRRPPLPAPALASMYRHYEEEKKRRGLVDFDDLLWLCAHALESDPEFAAVQRWRFRHLFVDEFQDVNPVQFRLLEGWRGGRSDLCVVGDPDQAIYSWNGADAGYLTDFCSRFAGAETVSLEDNYRSTPQVLAVANAVRQSGRHHGGPLRAHNEHGPAPSVRSHPTDRDEAGAVVRSIRDHHGPSTPWSHLAVLTRTNAQLVLFEEALRAAHIPYRLRGGAAFLDQPLVRQILADLRRRRPSTRLASVLVDLNEEAASEATLDQASASPDGHRHAEVLARMANEHLAADPAASLDGFLSWITAALNREAPQSGGDAVELATFHAAKGLEWPIVFLAGLEKGLVPIGHADTDEARDEERRLLYVAVTRARAQLHCSWAQRRTFGTRTLHRSPSPYLTTVLAAVRALAEGPTADWRRFLDDGRTSLKGPAGGGGRLKKSPRVGDGADPVVLAALKTWRTATAKASGVPAYVVFHDTTLAAIAEARPRDTAGLLDIPGVGPVKAQRYGPALLAETAKAKPDGEVGTVVAAGV